MSAVILPFPRGRSRLQQATRPDFDRLAEEAGGSLEFRLYGPHNWGHLLALAARGDQRAARVAEAVTETVRNVIVAEKSQPMPCSACRQPISPPDGFRVGVVTLSGDQPQPIPTCQICQRCGATDTAAIEAVRHIWPCAWPFVVAQTEGLAGPDRTSRGGGQT